MGSSVKGMVGLRGIWGKGDARVKFELLGLLISGPQDVGTLTHALRLDMPAISRNLKGLEERGLVVCRVDRNRRIYALTPAVRVTHHADTIELTIDAPAGGQFSIRIPRRLVEAAAAELQGSAHVHTVLPPIMPQT